MLVVQKRFNKKKMKNEIEMNKKYYLVEQMIWFIIIALIKENKNKKISFSTCLQKKVGNSYAFS